MAERNLQGPTINNSLNSAQPVPSPDANPGLIRPGKNWKTKNK